jgi:hypothetical protein
MHFEPSADMANVVRFPIERPAQPTLELLREIAPDAREVALVIEEPTSTADCAMAEHILNHVPREHGPARRVVLHRCWHRSSCKPSKPAARRMKPRRLQAPRATRLPGQGQGPVTGCCH